MRGWSGEVYAGVVSVEGQILGVTPASEKVENGFLQFRGQHHHAMMVGVVGAVSAEHSFQRVAYCLAVACLYVGEEAVESPCGTYDAGFLVVRAGVERGGCGIHGKALGGVVVKTKSCDVA